LTGNRDERKSRTHIQVDISARVHLFSCLKFRCCSAWHRHITSRNHQHHHYHRICFLCFFFLRKRKENQYNNDKDERI